MLSVKTCISTASGPRGPAAEADESGRSYLCLSGVFLIVFGLLVARPAEAGEKIIFRTQLPHTQPIIALRLSPDGRLAASGARDGLKLWDVRTGRLIRTLEGHEHWVLSLCFTPRGDRLLSAGGYPRTDSDDRIRVWDPATGAQLRAIDTSHGMVWSIDVSPNGESFVSAGKDGSLRLWELETGRMLDSFEGHTSQVMSVRFSPDGRSLLSASTDKTVKLWSVATRKCVRTWQGESQQRVVTFSPDGRLAVAGSSKGHVVVWEIGSGRKIASTDAHHSAVVSLSFSRDGKLLLSNAYKRGMNLWSLPKLSPVRTFSPGLRACLVPDGRTVVAGNPHGFLTVWDAATGLPIRISRAGVERLWSVGFYSDGRAAASGTIHGQVALWDLDAARLRRLFQTQKGAVHSLWSTQEGLRAVCWAKADNTTRILDMPGGRTLCSLERRHGYSLSISADATMAAVGVGRQVELWDIARGRVVGTLRGHHARVRSTDFDGEGKKLLTSDMNGVLKLWDVASGRCLHTLEGHQRTVESVSLSRDGRLGVSHSVDRTIRVWDLHRGGQMHKIVWEHGYREYPTYITLSPDSRLALATSPAGDMRLIDVAAGKVVRDLDIRGFRPAFSADGSLIILDAPDRTVRIVETGSEREVAAMAVATVNGQPEWAIWTPDNYFAASRRGGQIVHAVRGVSAFGIDQLALRNNRPDIVARRLGCSDGALISHYRRLHERRMERAGLTETQLTGQYHVPRAEILGITEDGKFVDLQLRLVDERFGLKTYNIYVNDVPLFGAYGREVEGREVTLNERVELVSGRNKIEVTCMNRRGAESWRAMADVVCHVKTRGALWFLGFGVSDYRDSRLDLKYADKDVRDLSRLCKQFGSDYSAVHTRVLLNEQVTEKAIAESKQWLKEATVDDTLILFIAGHGVYERGDDATYYYLTYETDLKRIAETAAAFETIEELLQGIGPRRKLFLMDTCESGELREETRRRFYALADRRGMRPRTSRGIAQVVAAAQGRPRRPRPWLRERDRYVYNDLLRRSGAVVLSSSRADEFSYESDRVENGYFTAGILRAMEQNAADKDGDGEVSIDELLAFVRPWVAQHTAGCQHPCIDRDNIYIDLSLPVPK